MKIKDIVNRDLVTLTCCEHEPIHVPGSIQPHGFLLGLGKEDFTITFCSGNTYEFIGIGFEQLLEKKFEQIAGKEQATALEKYISRLDQSFSPPLRLLLTGKAFTCVVQNNNAHVFVVEFERALGDELAIEDMYRQTKQFTAYMQKATTLKTLCQLVADETRAIIGYDRVMIYRFDEEYNGEVFAESKVDSVEPFLGLHYPHSDIPAQARDLYIKNLVRLIVDINYVPVPVYTTNEAATNSNLDLSLSTLRSVSPIHVEYLQNMGVGATLTISLLHENRLWGMITCHHYSARYINPDIRIAAQLQGHFLTSQLGVRQRAEEYEAAQEVNKKLEGLLKKAFATESITPEEILQQKELLTFAKADGVIFLIDNIVYMQGIVPPENEINKLAQWLYENCLVTGFFTSRLSKAYPSAEKWCGSASGIIYHSIGSGAGNCFILFRSEVLREIKWAGNPEKAIEKNENGLSPRKSFALWKENKKCESTPWQQAELLAASTFAHALQRHVHMVRLSKEELRQRKLSEKLKAANEELENINWIGSHDLQEPLRKIQLFASRILNPQSDAEEKDNTKKYVEKMSSSALRMQSLITDILAYSRLNHINEVMKDVSLHKIISQVVNDLSFEIKDKNALIDFINLPNVTGISLLLQQLFTNLLNNALKFSRQEIVPHIVITAKETFYTPPGSTPQHFHKINVADNGIGFDEKHKEQIFQVFQKLHTSQQYQGTGVGLALCKKIMQNHNGYIEVASTPGQGSTFMLFFPIK